MSDCQDRALLLPDEVAPPGALAARPDDTGAAEERPVAAPPTVSGAGPAEGAGAPTPDGDVRRRRAEAGRKGARRIHQLIQEGRLYEKEHGLKRGRQRLRQLIELGKRYEEEHGLRPPRPERRQGRLSRVRREELLGTLLECLLRLVRPSFRADLVRLIEALPREGKGHAV
jgi:hypothetical protein